MSDRSGKGSRWKAIKTEGAGAPTPERAPSPGPTGTFIGSGARFEGTLHLKGDFCIDSEFHGELETDGTLTVGEEGSVEGQIRARNVEIRGAVVGDVFARRLLVLCAGARLHGDIETACLEVHRNAFFKGTTEMTHPEASRQPEKRRGDRSRPSERGAVPPA